MAWLPAADVERFACQGTAEATDAIEQPGNCVLIAADEDGTRLGFAHARTEASVFTGEIVGYLSTIVVTGAAAGSGVGRALTLAAEQWARSEGLRLMVMEVFGGNHRAQDFYQRLGYQAQTLKLAKVIGAAALE